MGTVYLKQPLSSTEFETFEEEKDLPYEASTAEPALAANCRAQSGSNLAHRQQHALTQSVNRVLTTNTVRVVASPSSDQNSSASCTSFGAYPPKHFVIVGTRRRSSTAMESGCDLDTMAPSVLHLTQQRRSTTHVITATAPKPQDLKSSSLHYATFDPKHHPQQSAPRRLSYAYTTRDTVQVRGRRVDPVAMHKQPPQRYPKREIKFLTHSQACGTTVAGFAAFLMTILPPPDVSVKPCHQKETRVVPDSRIGTKETQSSPGTAHEGGCATLPSQGAKGRQVSLYDYLMLLRHRLMCCNSCFVIGGIYVSRFLRRHPELQIAPHELQYLSLISVVTAAKYIDDVFQTNSDYARVGGLPLNRFNTLEHYFLAGLGYSLHVTEEQFFAQLAVQESALAAGFAETARSALLLCRFTVLNPNAPPNGKYSHHRQHCDNQHQEGGARTAPAQPSSITVPIDGHSQVLTTEPHSASTRQQQVSYTEETRAMGSCRSGTCHVASCYASAGCGLPKTNSGDNRVSQRTMRVCLETPTLSGEVVQLSKGKVGGDMVTPVPRLSTVSTRAPSSVRAPSMSCEKEAFLNSSASSLSHSDTSSSSVALPLTKTPTTDDDMELMKHPHVDDSSFSRVDGTGVSGDVKKGGKRQQFASQPSGIETDGEKEAESDENPHASDDTIHNGSTGNSLPKPTVMNGNTINCVSCAWNEPHETSLPRSRVIQQHPSETRTTELLVPASYNVQIKRRTYAVHQSVPTPRNLRTAQDDVLNLCNQTCLQQSQTRSEIRDKNEQVSGHEMMQWQNVTHQNGCFAGVPVHTTALGANGFQSSSIQHSSPFRKKGNEGAYPFPSSSGQSCSTVPLHAHTLDWNPATKPTTRRLSDWVPASHIPRGEGWERCSDGDGGCISRLHHSHSGIWASHASDAATVCTRSQDVSAGSVCTSPSVAAALEELPGQFQESATCVRSDIPTAGKYLETSSSTTAQCSAKFGNAQGVGDQTNGLEFRTQQQQQYPAAMGTASGFCAAAAAPPPPPASQPPVQSGCHSEPHAPAQYDIPLQRGRKKTGSPRYPVFTISSGAPHCNVRGEAMAVGYYGTS